MPQKRVLAHSRTQCLFSEIRKSERSHFEVYAEGRMLHWPELDEDIEVQHIVGGQMPVKLSGTVSAVAEPHAEYGAGSSHQLEGRSKGTATRRMAKCALKKIS